MHGRGKQQSTQGRPSLPSKLNKELSEADGQLGARNERVSKAFAIADRKASRKAKRKEKGQQRHQFTQKHRQELPGNLPPARQISGTKRKLQALQVEHHKHNISMFLVFKQSVLCALQTESAKAKRVRPSEEPKTVQQLSVPKTKRKENNKSGKPARKATKFDELVEPASLEVSFDLPFPV